MAYKYHDLVKKIHEQNIRIQEIDERTKRIERTVVTKMRLTFTIFVVYALLLYSKSRYTAIMRVYNSSKDSLFTVLS